MLLGVNCDLSYISLHYKSHYHSKPISQEEHFNRIVYARLIH
jgi:hypothetical protein